MRGCITTRELFWNAPTIVREFGVVAYVKCLAACVLSPRRATFLSCVCRLENDAQR